MDEATRVRDLLERATIPEPPIGLMVQNALRAGARLRRRRRVAGFAAGTAAVGVICAAALAATVAAGNPHATVGNKRATVYVLGGTMTRHVPGGIITVGTVTPISAATNRPGQPIVLGLGSLELGELFPLPEMVITPNGKTIYAFDGSTAVLPIFTATNRAGRAIKVVRRGLNALEQFVVAPDGKTVYVLDSTWAVTPISTVTNRPGKPFELGQSFARHQMAITPDGKTIYVAISAGLGPSRVIPIATATGRPGRPIIVPADTTAIVAAPDGKVVYLVGDTGQEIEVTPISTATNTPGRPIIAGKQTGGVAIPAPPAMTPDGRTIYIPDYTNGVIPFATATDRPGKRISFGDARLTGIAIAPDGRTAYVLSQPAGPENFGGGLTCVGTPGAVTPVATATNTAGKPIRVGCEPRSIAFTPDGKTIYVGSWLGTVTPIATATGRPGKPIKVEQPVTITIAP